EVLVPEDFDVLIGVVPAPPVPVTLLDPCAVCVGDAIAFVAERFRLLVELLARINQHHAAAMAGGLVVTQKPDVSEDARVVEELVRQHDDGIEPVVLPDPAANLPLTRAAVPIAQR